MAKLTLNTKLKFLDAGRRAPLRRRTTWAEPGTWMPPIVGEIACCKNGYHVTTMEHWAAWVEAEAYTVEVRGSKAVDKVHHKTAHREARLVEPLANWNQRTAALMLGVVVDELEAAGKLRAAPAHNARMLIGMAARGERVSRDSRTARLVSRLWWDSDGVLAVLAALDAMLVEGATRWDHVALTVIRATHMLAGNDKAKHDDWRHHFAFALIALVTGEA